jgi:hypothetical protein
MLITGSVPGGLGGGVGFLISLAVSFLLISATVLLAKHFRAPDGNSSISWGEGTAISDERGVVSANFPSCRERLLVAVQLKVRDYSPDNHPSPKDGGGE